MTTPRQSKLLAALQRTPTSTAVPLPKAPLDTPPEPVVPRARLGKPVQFWMHEEDRKIIRELAAWLAGQGIRPTDSMVVRAALRSVKTGPGLLDAYRNAASLDGRLKSH